MKDRIVPCAECRKSRRKCVPTHSHKCVRCERFEKECTPESSSDQDDEEDIVDDLQKQVKELESAVQNMEIQLRTSCRRRNTNKLQNVMHQWKVQLENGTFRIETGIQNITDLMSFQANRVSYLSPFSENQIMIQFSRNSTRQLLIPFTLRLLVQNSKKPWNENASFDLPNNWNLDTVVMTIGQLVEIYFNCHYSYTPLLHKTSFMETFNQLEHPENDLLSLSICANVCASPCDHIPCLPSERRMLGDYFHNKAKSIILDQFDLPEKRLENVMSINLLTKYMHMTLKYNESRKLIGLAYQICVDLYHDNSEKDELYQMLYSRHITMTSYVNRFMNYISSNVGHDVLFCLPEWKFMSDESDEIQKFVKAQNWVLQLYNHTFVKEFLESINKIQSGYESTLSLESLIRLEGVLLEWGSHAPEVFKLCTDMNDTDALLEIIDNTTDCVMLISFIHYQSFIVSVYSSLLHPITLGDNDQLLSIVQQRSLEKSLTAGHVLIHAVSRISAIAEGTSLCYYKLAACDFMFHAINTLLVLSLSANVHVSRESRQMLKACLEEVVKQKFMQEQFLPRNGRITNTIDFEDESSFNLENYDAYALPWFAMVYDVSYHIASLDKHL
ncbi:hypothetical protein INT47_003044 [Mucor saturninus]|uniref:Zn(2)-C6 fungal-type domain-containing protein n=1 Tax=Mucor saturninus TaxID=64648 RepID=A0A8H7QVG2_9FUNG|nr:hypothetical protein INT47_003044 [Mucor saturninus]